MAPYNNNVVLEPMGDFTLWDKTGENTLYVRDVQGIVISDDGQFMYMSCGDDEHSQYERPEYGIHAFEVQNLQSGRRIGQSSMSEMPFKFDWDYGHESEEPEGITIWDLDGMEAPYISGQLHIMLLDNDEWQLNTDDVYLRHYTNVLYVDHRTHGNYGWPSAPFNTVSEANTYTWDGAQISIHAGTYAESLFIDKKVQLLATGGTVIIGAGARSSSSTLETVNTSGRAVELLP
ncbi:MAG: hypothetical protein JXA33_15090 [Anaerolineae bacterium]|nr:hypothetical protein [Anaerolineae bacterium]